MLTIMLDDDDSDDDDSVKGDGEVDDDEDDDDGVDGNHLQRNVSANVWRPVMWRANLNILPFQNHHHAPSHWYN